MTPLASPQEAGEGEVSATEVESAQGAEVSEADLLVYLQQAQARDRQRLDRLNEEAGRLTELFDSVSESAQGAVSAQETSATGDPEREEPSEGGVGMLGETLRNELDLLLQRRQASERQARVLQLKVEQQRELMDLVLLGDEWELEEVFLESDPAAELETAPEIPEGDAPAPSSVPGIDVSNPAPTESARPASPVETRPGNYSLEVVEARRELRRSIAEEEALQRRLAKIDQLIALNEADLSLAQSMAVTSQRALELLQLTLTTVEQELEALTPADETARETLQSRVNRLRELLDETMVVSEQDESTARALGERVETLAVFRDPVLGNLSKGQQQVESARYKLAFLESPLAPHNVERWLVSSGPRLLIAIGILVVVWFILRALSRRIFGRVVSRSHYSSEDERLERVDTLARVSRNAVTIIVLILGLLAILPEFGIDVRVLLGSAAVLSLAIAFGAQALVKDYFSGVMILAENQYRVGNVIRVNDIVGLVEDITLRVTMLRDLDGLAHFIPHGQITIVSNVSHGWSRAVFDIGVAYKENVDRVIEVITELAKGMRNDLEFGPYIIEDPEIFGVDALTDSAVVIKFVIKTRPLKHVTVKREMLRRIKNRFDELGIEIPFPHRTVYHRNGDAEQSKTSREPDVTDEL